MIKTRSQILAELLQNNKSYNMGQSLLQQGMRQAYTPGQAAGNSLTTLAGYLASNKGEQQANKQADAKTLEMARLLSNNGFNVPQGVDPGMALPIIQAKANMDLAKQGQQFQQQQFAYQQGQDKQNNALQMARLDLAKQNANQETWGSPTEVRGQDGNPMLVQVSNKGNMRPVEGYGPKQKEPKPPTIKTIFDDATGLRQTVQWNPQANEWQPIGGVEAPNGMTVSVGADGEVTLVQGPGASSAKPMTEQQSKDAVYYTRAKGALETFEKVAGELTSATNRALDLDSTGIIRRFQDEDFQVAQAAGREFLAAFLRKDTGAAITEAEMQQYGSIYIPAPGDSDQALEYKREARQRALNAIRAGMAPQAIMNAEMALRTGGKPQPDKTLSADNTQMIPDEINAGGWGVKELE